MTEDQFIQRPSAQGENVAEQNEWPISEALSDTDRAEFFRLYETIYGATPSEAEERAQRCVRLFQRMSTGDRHVYVIRDPNGAVVAGAEMTIQQNNNRKEAYFGRKVVAKEFRGTGLASQLVEDRLSRAREAGCTEAYALIERTNIPALRTILRDGFTLRGNGKDKTGFDGSRNCYYASLDMTSDRTGSTQSPPSTDALRRAKPIHALEELDGSPALVSIDQPELIESVIHIGYRGLSIVLPNDLEEIPAPMVYLEPIPKTIQ